MYTYRVYTYIREYEQKANMPRFNIFIRKDNLDTWDSIEHKSEWVNDKLSNTVDAIFTATWTPPVKKQLDTSKPVITAKNKDMAFCSHNAVKGFCKKGCK